MLPVSAAHARWCPQIDVSKGLGAPQLRLLWQLFHQYDCWRPWLGRSAGTALWTPDFDAIYYTFIYKKNTERPIYI
jgi:hypothetical protein